MRTLPALLLLFVPLPALAEQPTPDTKDIPALVEEARKAFGAPGVAVAIVRDDKVIYLAGHGVREEGKQEPVTPDTVFAIGSLTKAFTATTMAKLIDDGKLKWDDPVRKHVEFFHLSDPLADRDCTLRDLLCHRTGLARHDDLWRDAPWDLQESIRRMAHLEPAGSFRSGYRYNNLCYLVCGFAIASASGESWQDCMRKSLLEPLGMKGTVFTRSQALKASDHATPHNRSETRKALTAEWYDDDKQIRASGSLKTNVRDLSQWLRFQLAEGSIDGKRLVSRENLRETRRGQVVLPVPESQAREMETTQATYGLGWQLYDYRGHHVVQHGGSVPGFRAHVALVPKKQLGVVVLTNLNGTDLPPALCLALLDHQLGLEKKDWNKFYVDSARRVREGQAESVRTFRAKQQKGTKPSRELDAYAGEYTHPAYGSAKVTVEKGELLLIWAKAKLPLKHYHYDTFAAAASGRFANEVVVFTLGPDGDPTRLRFLEQEFKRQK